MNVAAGIPATAGIIFRNFLSGKRRIHKEVKSFETAIVTHGFPWPMASDWGGA